MRVYLVGGAVRDGLLGLPVRERDWVVTGATPDDMRAQGFVPVDGTFPCSASPPTATSMRWRGWKRSTAAGIAASASIAARM